MQFLSVLTSITAFAGIALANPVALPVPAGKPTGGPASASVTVYSGPATCADPNTPPTAADNPGVAKTVSITENSCVIVNIPFGGAITASMTATPKTGTTACYIQIFTQAGCGLTLQNQYHGFPFNGLSLGSQVGCAQPPVQAYGALQILRIFQQLSV
ncbi:hypothetical protein Q7P36_007033 [Cladosporium allicinum]